MDVHRPAFIMFFCPYINSQQMGVPPAFTRQVLGYMPEKVHLRDRFNNLWQVKVAKVGENLYFRDGWIKFLEDNSLKNADLMVFQQLSEGVFNVKIFDASLCETAGARGLINANGVEQQVDIPELDEHVDEEDDESEVSEEDDEDYEDLNSDDFNPPGHERKPRKKHGVVPKEKSGRKKIIAVINVDDDEEDELRVDDVVQPGRDNKLRKKRNNNGKRKSRHMKRIDIYGVELFESGVSPQPKNPYFLTHVCSRKSSLHVPRYVINDQNLELPLEILLVDSKGRKWKSRRRSWHDGRVIYTGGWRSLCQINLIKPDDTVICEFVKNKIELLDLHISIIRASQLSQV